MVIFSSLQFLFLRLCGANILLKVIFGKYQVIFLSFNRYVIVYQCNNFTQIMTLGNIIRRKREQSGLKQGAVATHLGIGQSAYVKIEQGTTQVTIDRLYMLAALFKCSILEFITLNDKDIAIIKEEHRFQGSTIELYKGLYESEQRDKEAWRKEYNDLKKDFEQFKTKRSRGYKSSEALSIAAEPTGTKKK